MALVREFSLYSNNLFYLKKGGDIMNWDKIAELVVDTFLYVSSFVIVVAIIIIFAFYIGAKFFNV